MKKKQKKSTKRSSLLNELQIFLRKNFVSASLVILVVLLVVFSPYIFSYAKYGYYYLKCGKKPVTSSDFAGKHPYTLPSDNENYKITPLSIYFCSEADARTDQRLPRT